MRLRLLIPLLVAMSCEFPLKEENNLDISPISKADVKIDLNNMPDTLSVFEDVSISYSLSLTTIPAIAVFVVIDNIPQYYGYEYEGKIVIPKNLMLNNEFGTKGYVPFEFAVFSTSSTGSLADLSQRELLLFSEKRVLFFDYTPTKILDFKSSEIKNGSIFLTWEKYPHLNLRSLKLGITTYSPGSSTPVFQTIELDKNSTSYVDNTFLGAQIEYELITENNLSIKKIGPKVKFNLEPSKLLEFKTTGANQLELKWSKATLYGNSNGYEIIAAGYGTLFSTSNPNDTTAIITYVPFGKPVDLVLRTISKNIANNVSTISSVWVGEKIVTPVRIIVDPLRNTFYYLNSPYLIRERSEIKDSVYVDFDNASPYFFSLTGESLYVSKESTILEIQVSDLLIKKAYSLSIHGVYSFVSHSNNFLVTQPFFNSQTRLNVLDQTTGLSLQYYDLNCTGSSFMSNMYPTPSPTRFIVEGDGVCVFEMSDNGFIISDKCLQGITSVFSSDDNFLYTFNQNNRFKYTFPDLQLVETIENTDFFANINMDRGGKVFGKIVGSSFNIFDVESLKVLKYIPLAGSIPSSNIVLKEGVLFIDAGNNISYRLRLE